MLRVLPFFLSFCPFLFSLSAFRPALLLLSSVLGLVLLSWLCGLVSWCVGVVGFLSLSDDFRYEKRGANLRPFLRSCMLLFCQI